MIDLASYSALCGSFFSYIWMFFLKFIKKKFIRDKWNIPLEIFVGNILMISIWFYIIVDSLLYTENTILYRCIAANFMSFINYLAIFDIFGIILLLLVK